MRRQFLRGVEAYCGRVFLLVCWLVLGQPLSAPAADGDLVWERYVTSNLTASRIFPKSVARDTAGSTFMAGTFQGAFDFDPGPGTTVFASRPPRDNLERYESDAFVVKLDASGEFAWARRMGWKHDDDGSGVAVDNNGDVLLVGACANRTSLSGGLDTTNIPDLGDFRSAVVVKLNSSGDFVWNWSMEGLAHDCLVAVDSRSNVFLTGSMFSMEGHSPAPGKPHFQLIGAKDIFVLKLDSSGKFLWARNFGGFQPHSVNGIAVDGVGNVYVAGEFGDTIEFDSHSGKTTLSCSGGVAAFLVKYDASGGYVWAKVIGGSIAKGHGVAVDANGNIFLAGSLYGSADFDPGPNNAILDSSRDGSDFVVKLDASGDFKWAKGMGGPSSPTASNVSVGVDGYGNVFLAGGFRDTADFDPGAGTTLLDAAGMEDVYVLKLDPLGGLVWAQQIGDSGEDSSVGINVDSHGEVLVAGNFDHTVQLLPHHQPQGTTFDSARGAFLVRLEGTTGASPDQLISCLMLLFVMFMGFLWVRRAAKTKRTKAG